MAGVDEESQKLHEISDNMTDNIKMEETTVEEQKINQEGVTPTPLEHLDSFEKLEAQLLSANSFDEATPSGSGKVRSDFSEDYSMKDGTYLDTGKFSDPRTFDIIKDLETLERLRTLEVENEEDLERREVAALIKRAEEKLLPTEKDLEVYETTSENTLETSVEPQVAIPELVELEKPLSSSDLIRMESSDLSEEEGFRLRLSCIFEESESDTASMSGSIIKQLPGKEIINNVQKVVKEKEIEDPPKIDENVGAASQTNSEAVLMSNVEISQLNGDNDPIHGLEDVQETAITAMNLDEPPQNETDILEEISNIPSNQEIQSELNSSFQTDKMDEDSIDTPSQSPEPKPFDIQKLKSGSNVDKLLTKPLVIRRLESSSESSLDISTTLSSPGADVEQYNIIELDVQASERLSRTPENVRVELGKSSQPSPNPEPTGNHDITEIAEDEAFLSNVSKRRRGKSLESGMAEKASEEKNLKEKEHAKLETKSQKGEEERPPVPPETYLWEELRRWRLKGGYPWTHLDKPPFDEKTWKYNTDHEYEPINPPPTTDAITERPRRDGEDALEERRFLRIPRDEELVLSPEDMEVEAIAAAQDLQDDLEGRFLATTPMTGTTASRTDCDVNTSMLDSSGLEDLPLKRGARTKKAIQSKTEQMRAQAQGIQQRLRSQAGKLRNKLRSIPRPSFQRKQDRERQRSSPTEPQKSRFRLPERPKISLPERPKFNFPERPKFKMPQKPKLNLPNFSNPLKERQTNTLQTEPKRKIFDIDFKTYPRMFSKKSRDRGDYATSSPKLQRSATPPPAPIQPSRKKGPIGQRWVNRFDDIKFVDDKGSEVSQRSESEESLSGFHDKDFAITDDLDHTQLPPARTRSTKSSISHQSDREEIPSSRSSFERHRTGVIEEIDSDQFFLRQKGISEEDIDMGKYLSEEIREAFRSPVVNALRQLDYDYEEDEEKENYRKNIEEEEPLPPSRMRSLKKTKAIAKEIQRAKSLEEGTSQHRYENNIEDQEPANQPEVSGGNIEQAQSSRHENVESNTRSRYENIDDDAIQRYENIPENIKDRYGTIEDSGSEYYKSPPAPQEYQHYKVPRSAPIPSKRKTSATEQNANKKRQNGWVEVEVETSIEMVEAEPVPQPQKRTKSKRSFGGKQESVEVEINKQDSAEPEYIIPQVTSEQPPPDPPRRFRSLSRGARSIHSLAQEEEDKKAEASYPEAPIRYRSLSRGARSNHSLAQDQNERNSEAPPPEAPIRYRSLSRGARSIHSLAQEEEIKPVPPKRTSSKRSLHSLGLAAEKQDTRSLHSLAMEYETKSPVQKRNKSLSRGSRSFHSIAADQEDQPPAPPTRTRSNSRGSRSLHSLADGDHSKSLPRGSKIRENYERNVEQENIRGHIYESPTDGYAVVDKGGSKPKPPRPPPPRRKKGSQSPNFNTFPRRSPMRPTRAYATLGPSRPPRKSKPKPAQSVEHIYQSDQISQAYLEVENEIKLASFEDLHGSNKDLQADDVVEKMKGRPLPAPPRPPRLRTRAEEPSMEEVEEVCVSTQTDPLPDDLMLEDDMMQELSHEEYKMQEAFLQAMREEDERIQKDIEERKAKQLADEAQKALDKEKAEQQQLEHENEVRRQQERLAAPEQTTQAPDRNPTRPNRRQSDDLDSKKKTLQLETEDDMGYASLDRRQVRVEEEPQPSASFQQNESENVQQHHQQQPPAPQATAAQAAPVYIPVIPEVLSTDRLRVGSLEVERLQVNELQAAILQVQDLRTHTIHSNDLQGVALHITDITSQAGQLNLGNIELPPDFIQQIIARIPWEQLRPQQTLFQDENLGRSTAVDRVAPLADEQPNIQQQVSTTRRRHRHLRQHSSRSQHSSEEEDTARQSRRQLRTASSSDPNILDLSRQLARACSNAGFRAIREFADQVRVPEQEDRRQYIRTILCILFVAIAGYFLIWHIGSTVHHHHWDFQFPPQPPRQ